MIIYSAQKSIEKRKPAFYHLTVLWRTHQGLRKCKFVKNGEKNNSKAKLVQASFTSRGLLTF